MANPKDIKKGDTVKIAGKPHTAAEDASKDDGTDFTSFQTTDGKTVMAQKGTPIETDK